MNIRHFFGRKAALCLVASAACLSAAAFDYSPETISPTNLPDGLGYEDGYYISSALYLDNFKVEWTDSKGIKHTNSILDRATEREHIIALIKEVYTNPLIPGYVEDVTAYFDDVEEGADRQKYDEQFVPYKPCTEYPYNMPADMVIEKPIPGATALLVELKNSFPSVGGTGDNVARSFDEIRAVTVVPNQTYVGSTEEAANPGFIFNLEVSMNKGFLMTKGGIRRLYLAGTLEPDPNYKGTQPFYRMFEEFSPSNSKTIYGVYNQMRAGELFPVDHNCSSVMAQGHDMVMVGQGENENRAINFRFFLPDWRFRGITRTNDQHVNQVYQHYSFYAEKYQPYFFFNFIDARVQGYALTGEQNEQAWIKIKWESHAKDITQSKLPEEFYIYRVVNDVVSDTPVLFDEVQTSQEGTELTADPNGYALITRSTSTDVIAEVLEDRNEEGRVITYVVSGRPVDSDFGFVSSNQTAAILPGLSPNVVLKLMINGEPKSKFDIPTLTNHYNNTIKLVEDEKFTKLTYGAVKGKSVEFHVHRIANGEAERFASFTLDDTGIEGSDNSTIVSGSDWGVVKYVAPITYYNPETGEEIPTPDDASEEVELKFDTYKYGDEAVAIALDNHDGIMANFVDAFSVSTATDSHPAGYDYRIVCMPDGNEGSLLESNRVTVAVIKRNLYIGYEAYSEEQAMNDTDFGNRLKESRIGLAVETRTNVNINGYTVYDVTDINKPSRVAFIDRYPDGAFEINILDENGKVNDNVTNKRTQAGYTGKVTAIMPFGIVPGHSYILRTEYISKTGEDLGNTYGNAIVVMPEITVPQFTDIKLHYEQPNNDGTHTYHASVTWDNPELTSFRPRPAVEDDNELYYLNIQHALWGSVPDGFNPENTDEFSLMLHFNQSADTEASPSRPNRAPATYSTGASTSAEYYFTHENMASEETPVNSGHYIRRYTELPARANISRAADPAERAYAVKDNYVAVSIKSTDSNPGMSGVEDVIDSEIDGFEQLYDLQGRPVNSSAVVPGLYLRRTSAGVSKVYIK